MNHQKIIVIFFIFISFFLQGCAYSPKYENTYDKNAAEHILRVNKHGYLIPSDIVLKPAVTRQTVKSVLSEFEAKNKFKRMLHGAMELACQKKHFSSQAMCIEALTPYLENDTDHIVTTDLLIGAKVKILVFFHGGLNTYADSDERMEGEKKKEGQLRLIEDRSGDPTLNRDWHYPIYVSWPSNVGGTIWEHWTSNREGRWTPWYTGYLSAPLIIFQDIFSSVAEFPSNVYYQFTNDKDRLLSSSEDYVSSIWIEAFYQYKKQLDPTETVDYNDFHVGKVRDNENITINRSRYSRHGLLHSLEATGLALLTPFRYPIGSIWNGALANNSWSMMKRRASNLVHPTGDFQKRLGEKNLAGLHIGAFFQELFALQKDNPEMDIELTLIGHSMGAIAINNLLSKYQDEWSKTPVLANIVYMAAAASIEDTLSIVPDVIRANPNQVPFYNLTLNRVSEVAETYMGGPSTIRLVAGFY